MHRSVVTIGADLALSIFGADGSGIVWAIIDSGIDASHPHFRMHGNLELPSPLQHFDFTVDDSSKGALVDEFGHGTMVAGLIAGERKAGKRGITGMTRTMDARGELVKESVRLEAMRGIASRCKLMSLKVLDEHGHGEVSSLIAALARIQEINGFGRQLNVHGVLIGLSYSFDQKQFACGLSPLCVEVERLIRSGVVVVVAAGNDGSGTVSTVSGTKEAVIQGSIGDPGNAELAITVGSTHRDLPQLYGVSYFSSKGPTADGRNKPDLVAPGDRILCCATGKSKEDFDAGDRVEYVETSGASIAAAHVAGAIASLLSAERQMIGKPEAVKKLLMDTAEDLHRTPSFQGRGMVKLLNAIVAAKKGPDGLEAAVRTTAPAQPDKSVPQPKRLLCSYAHEDEQLWNELKDHLKLLERRKLLRIWYDRAIAPGAEWDQEIKRKLEEADIILLLVSSSFLASDYAYGIELQRALDRHEQGTARVIPVVVRPVDWEGAPFAKLQALPKDAEPVTKWKDQHEAWAQVAKEIRKLLVPGGE